MPGNSAGETRRGGYDKDLVNREVLAVCDHYLGHRRREGKRQTYVCPLCGGRRFEVEPNRGYAGCFDPDCPVPTTTDALGIIAYFEDLELAGRGFVECLRRGYDILGLPEPVREGALEGAGEKGGCDRRRERGGGTPPDPGSRWGAAATEGPVPEGSTLEQPVQAWQEHVDGSRSAIPAVLIHEHEADRETLDLREERPVSTGGVDAAGRSRVSREPDSDLQRAQAVYEELLRLCPLEDRDREFFCERGLDPGTITDGLYGSISRARCGHVLETLRGRFADEELLAVPGFYRATGGQLRFSLYGDYALIPYHDRDGYIRTVEGRFTGEGMGVYDRKYKALSGSGVHLYVHPRFSPDEVVAFCEGAVGAMVAARYGFAVASIKGFRNYRRPPESRDGDYSVLPELEGVDFAGRNVVYIPDVDVKPKSYETVMDTVPEACRWMIESQGGHAKVARLPDGAKDLDSWILSLDEEERTSRIEELLAGALDLGEWEGMYLGAARHLGARHPNASEGAGEPEFEEVGGQDVGEAGPAGDRPAAGEPRQRAESEVDGREPREGVGEGSRPEGASDHASGQSGTGGSGLSSSDYEVGAEPEHPAERESPDDDTAELEPEPHREASSRGANPTGDLRHEGRDEASRRAMTRRVTGERCEPGDGLPEPSFGPGYGVRVAGERHLIGLVYVVAAALISAFMWFALGGWFTTAGSVVIGALLAIWVAAGCRGLLRRRRQRQLRAHVQGY